MHTKPPIHSSVTLGVEYKSIPSPGMLEFAFILLVPKSWFMGRSYAYAIDSCRTYRYLFRTSVFY